MIRAFRFYSKVSSIKLIKERINVSSGPRYFSYLHLGGELPLTYRTLGDLLDEAAEKFGDRTAFVSVHQDLRITFQETKQQAECFAAGILGLGLEKGDRVALFSSNSLEWYITSMALAKAGVVSVYLNPGYQAMEVAHCLNAVEVKMLVTAESFRGQSYFPLFEEIIPELSACTPGELKCEKVPSLRSVVCISEESHPGIIPFKCVHEKATEESWKKLYGMKKLLSADDASYIKFTSGTTGTPKGVVLSHFNIVNNSFFMARRQDFHLKEHIMCFMGPLFHAMGSVIGVLVCLHYGVTLVIPDSFYSPVNAAKAIVDENCTVLLGTPTMYVDIIREMQEKGIKAKTPEVAISGGAVASSTLFHEMLKTLGVKRVSSIYGLTETGPAIFMSKTNDDVEKMTTTVGHLLNHTEVKVVDDQGKIVPWNTPGELWVRGYLIMKGYYNDEKKTKEVITPENWFRTGDQCSMTPDGYAKIVGRIKDIIIRGGENIFPEDVENYLITHPDILEVQIVGVPDKRLGEQVCACIRLQTSSKLTEDQVKAFCQGKIANHLIPFYVYFLDEFPKTPSGKIQKFALRKLAIEHFKLTEE